MLCRSLSLRQVRLPGNLLRVKTAIYIVRDGTIERGEGTIRLTDDWGRPQYIPIENVESLQIAGTAAITAAAVSLLSRHRIPVVWLNWRMETTACAETLIDKTNGDVVLGQAENYANARARLLLAKEVLRGAAHSMQTVLRYHYHRGGGTDPSAIDDEPKGESIDALMGWEGINRRAYYEQIDKLLPDGMKIDGRRYRPAGNYANALMSFLNSLTYTVCHISLSEAGLCASIPVLHAIAGKRNSLALDLAEIFKPLLADRVLLALVRMKSLKGSHFEEANYRLTSEGRFKVIEAWDAKLSETQMHRRLDRKVTWRELVRLEALKLSKHMLGIEAYVAFRANQ